jgi:hypothetical protein
VITPRLLVLSLLGLVATGGGVFLARELPIMGASASPDGTSPPEPRSAEDVAAFADGVVTFEEYDAAFQREAACFREAGFAFAEGPTLTRFGSYYFVLRYDGTDGASLEETHNRAEACGRGHFDAIGFAWARDHGPTAEDLELGREVTTKCLLERGYAIKEGLTADEFVFALGMDGHRAPAVVVECLKHTAEELNWPGYGP